MKDAVTKGINYEEHVVELLTRYGMKAFRTNKANEADPEQYKAGFDGGVDIIASFSNDRSKVYKYFVFYIQCKCHKKDLTKQAISEVYAGMHARNATNKYCIPVVFCSSNASKETRQFAKDLGVELFLQEHIAIIDQALLGNQIPYDKYGIFMKILLYKVTKNRVWLDTLPDYQNTICDMTQLQRQIMTSELDFNEAQAYLDEAQQYERRANEQRQKALDIQKNAVMRCLQVSGTIKERTSKNQKATNDLEGG